MFEKENPVIEEITENTEETAEETTEEVEVKPDETSKKVYTEKEFQERIQRILDKKIPRTEAKIRREYEQKYGSLENVLKAGTGSESVKELTDNFRKFYESKGIEIPTEPTYSDRDIKILAKAEAEEIISLGLEEVVEEVDRLTKLGVNNMDPREKEVFRTLAQYRKTAEESKELAKIGVTEEVYNSKEFRDFAGKFNSNTPIKDIYDIYAKMQPKKPIKPMGSIKSGNAGDTGVKDFYSFEEAKKFTKQDFDRNPELFKAVERSMHKW